MTRKALSDKTDIMISIQVLLESNKVNPLFMENKDPQFHHPLHIYRLLILYHLRMNQHKTLGSIGGILKSQELLSHLQWERPGIQRSLEISQHGRETENVMEGDTCHPQKFCKAQMSLTWLWWNEAPLHHTPTNHHHDDNIPPLQSSGHVCSPPRQTTSTTPFGL